MSLVNVSKRKPIGDGWKRTGRRCAPRAGVEVFQGPGAGHHSPTWREYSGWLSPEDHGDPRTVRPRRLEVPYDPSARGSCSKGRRGALSEGDSAADPLHLLKISGSTLLSY